jgi:hypothetical protein
MDWNAACKAAITTTYSIIHITSLPIGLAPTFGVFLNVAVT